VYRELFQGTCSAELLFGGESRNLNGMFCVQHTKHLISLSDTKHNFSTAHNTTQCLSFSIDFQYLISLPVLLLWELFYAGMGTVPIYFAARGSQTQRRFEFIELRNLEICRGSNNLGLQFAKKSIYFLMKGIFTTTKS